MVERQSWKSGSGRETLPDIRKWSGDPPGDPDLAGRPTQRSGCGRETLSEVRNCAGDPPEGP